MIRRISSFAFVVSVVVVGVMPTVATADGGGGSDHGIHRTGQHRARTYARWALGASPSPLLASLEGDCGGIVRGAFFIAPPIAEGLDQHCRVPAGKAIVFSHAAWFSTIPADGSTDAEIIEAADTGFAPVATWLKFDGRRVGLNGKTVHGGAFTIHSEPGSFYDAIGIGTGSIRTALTASFITVPPGLCGRHVIKSFVDFGVPDEMFSGTYHIKVVGCDH